MAIDGYMFFKDYNDAFLVSESQVKLVDNAECKDLMDPFKEAYGSTKGINRSVDKNKNGTLFEIEDYSFDIEQTLNIGSQSTGAGAGRVTFNPFSITRKIDCASPMFFQISCSGTPFQKVCLGLRKCWRWPNFWRMFVVFSFSSSSRSRRSAGRMTMSSPKETVTFEYGGFQHHVFAAGARRQAGGRDPRRLESCQERQRGPGNRGELLDQEILVSIGLAMVKRAETNAWMLVKPSDPAASMRLWPL